MPPDPSREPHNFPPSLSLFEKILYFLSRPYGGIELEFVLSALIGLPWGLAVIFDPNTALGRSPTFDVVWYEVEYSRLIGFLWIGAAALNISGIVLFMRGNQLCAELRLIGSVLSIIAWSWVLILAILAGKSLLLMIISGAFLVSFIRVMSGAWRRHEMYRR